MVTPCRAQFEAQVTQESHEFSEDDVLVGGSSENLHEQLRSRRHVSEDSTLSRLSAALRTPALRLLICGVYSAHNVRACPALLVARSSTSDLAKPRTEPLPRMPTHPA